MTDITALARKADHPFDDAAVEAAAKAICASRGVEAATLFQWFEGDEWPVEFTDSNGLKFYEAWRKSVPHAIAALTAAFKSMKDRGMARVELENGPIDENRMMRQYSVTIIRHKA